MQRLVGVAQQRGLCFTQWRWPLVVHVLVLLRHGNNAKALQYEWVYARRSNETTVKEEFRRSCHRDQYVVVIMRAMEPASWDTEPAYQVWQRTQSRVQWHAFIVLIFTFCAFVGGPDAALLPRALADFTVLYLVGPLFSAHNTVVVRL